MPMFNLLYAAGFGSALAALLALPRWLSWPEAIVPGVLVAIVAYMFLARRTYKKLEGIMMRGAASLQQQPPRPEQAIAIMREGYTLARTQFGVRSQVDAQIGILYFLQREFGRAQPFLARSYLFGHWMAGAMLAVVQYKKKDVAGMHRTFAAVLRKGKKQGLVHSLYAYLLCQLGERDRAVRVLHAAANLPNPDPRVKEGLLALQNGKKLKMRAYKEQWYQFHLERPPVMHEAQARGGYGGRSARRG